MIELSDYYSGGFFLVRASPKPKWEDANRQDYLPFVPEKIVSLSRCFCAHFEVNWASSPSHYEAALKFGIPAEKLDEFKIWWADESDMGLWSMFRSLEAARKFIQQFLPNHDDLYLIETGLPKTIAETKWRESYLDKQDYKGIEERVGKHLPLVAGSTVLGFEVVSFGYGDFGHSWLCSGLDQDMHDLFGIVPNEYGFIPTYAEAMQVYNWIAEDEMKGTRAEPEPYDAWLLVSHPLT